MVEPVDLNALGLEGVYAALSEGGLTRRLFELMRDEDLGVGGGRWGTGGRDVTSEACFEGGSGEGAPVRARLVAREGCVVAGLAAIEELAGVFGFEIGVEVALGDGGVARAGETLVGLEGVGGELLVLERSLLNLVSRLSGVATETARYVEVLEREAPGSRARLYDTRKTTPGMRVLEKYAVRCGGGMCHRIGLHDAALIKDNHLAGVGRGELGGFVSAAAVRGRAAGGVRFVEVEVDCVWQFEEVLALEDGVVDIVLLDNMGLDDLGACVGLRDRSGRRVLLEASGGVRLETIGGIARTGVERISVGALTHGARGVDLGLDVV